MLANGTKVVRFWEQEPAGSCSPHGLLPEDLNDIIVFETEGIYSDELAVSSRPVIDERVGKESK